MSSRANRARLVIRQGVLAICSLPLVAGTPQEKTLRRERLVGRIRDLAQQPWPGARVFLMSRPVPGLDRVGDADEVETKTDGRGRFRAMLLPGRSYTAWAAGAAETGRYRRTRTVENVHAGRPVRLEEADEAGIRSRCRISGREAWGEGLRFELVVDTENRHVLAVKPDARGELEFPMLPEGRLFLEMYGSEGIPLFGTELSGSIETREIPLPTPCSVLVRVLDRGGRAVAGANIYRQTRQGRVWQRIAVSGADGFASILLPGARSSGDGTVRVRAALRADSPAHALGRIATSVGLQTHRDLSKLRASRQPDITLRLWPGLSVKGRILVDESRPAAGLPLLVYGPIVRGKSSWTHPGDAMLYRTREDGSFEIPGRHASCAHRLCAVLSDALIQSLPPWGPPLHPVAVLSLGADERRRNLGTLRLDEIPAFDIEVRDADGSAVTCPALTIGSKELRIEGAIGPYHGMRVAAGRRGSLRFLSRDAGSLVLLASSGLRFGWRYLEESATDATLQVLLGAGVSVTGRVLDASKRPIPDAVVHLSPSRAKGLGSGRLLRWVGSVKTTTDGAGRFELRVQPDCDYRIWATAPDGEGQRRSTPRETLHVEDRAPPGRELILGKTKREPPRPIPVPPGKRRRW